MNQRSENLKQASFKRSRRAAWWTSGVFAALGVISLAEGQFDQGFGGVCLVIALLLFVWGLDYHRRLRVDETTSSTP